jgi:hypothetical protein
VGQQGTDEKRIPDRNGETKKQISKVRFERRVEPRTIPLPNEGVLTEGEARASIEFLRASAWTSLLLLPKLCFEKRR